MKIGLQLWSVKDQILTPEWQSNGKLFDVIEKIAAMGFDGIEWALGDQGYTGAEIKAKLDEVGLVISSAHVAIEALRADFEGTIKFNKEIGNPYIIVPYADYDTVEDWLKFAEELGEMNKRVEAEGLRFTFHNHFKEFTKVSDDKYVLDAIYEHVPGTEIDIYWVDHSGIDPVDYLKKYAGRTSHIHMKDRHPSKEESTIVGEGTIDMKAVVDYAKENGTEWLILEQEAFEKPSLESVEQGLKNLRGML